MSQPEAQYGSSGWVAGLLISKLGSTNLWVAEVAESELVWLGNDAIPVLKQALDSPDWNLRWRSVRVLSRLQHPEVVPLLIQAYRRAELVNGRGRSLYPFGREVVYYEGPNPPDTLRLTIVKIMGNHQGVETVPFLCEALQDAREEVRCAAAAGLARQAPAGSIADLRNALPCLRELTGRWRQGTDAEYLAYREALECIEAITAATEHLPIPAAPATADPRDLPVPAASQEPGGTEALVAASNSGDD